MTTDQTPDDIAAARHLASQARRVRWVSGKEPWCDLVRWLNRGQYGQRHGWPEVPQLDAPWQDTSRLNGSAGSGPRTSTEKRPSPSTMRSAAAAGSNSLSPCPATSNADWPPRDPPHCAPNTPAWHTLGGLFDGSGPFWTAAGTGAYLAGYQQRDSCLHITADG